MVLFIFKLSNINESSTRELVFICRDKLKGMNVVTRQVYEEAEAELDELMKRRENLEDSLIYTNESSYLEEGGNLIHGFSGYLKPLSQQDKRKKEIIQEDRIFSNSSFNYEEVMEFVTEEESSSSDEYNKKSGRSSLLANYSLNKRATRIRLIISSRELKKEKQGQINT
nr:572_t:CDS:2 [Entrophospora candida]